MSAKAIKKQIRQHVDNYKSSILSRFFKTGRGEYGFGDKFLGVPVPMTRAVVKPFLKTSTIGDAEELLKSTFHEDRLAGVFLLNYLYIENPKKVFKVYVANTGFGKGINNWDLIDTSSEHIIGPYISDHMDHENRKIFIDKCIVSKDLWVRRMIVLASFYQIKKGNEKLTLYIAERLLKDTHDLIHKSVGWMLREVGKRVDRKHLVEFLKKFHTEMPRTMFRYAIEHLDKKNLGF